MRQSVEQCGGHLGIAKDRSPFAEAQVGGDDNTCALVKLAQQVEQQRATRGAERQVSQLVQDHQIEAGQAFGDLSGLTLRLFLFQRVDQLESREEANLSAVMLDGLYAQGGRDMGLAGARSADQDDVLRAVHELAAMQRPGRCLVDLADGRQ